MIRMIVMYSASISKYYECEFKYKVHIPDSELPSLQHPGKNATSSEGSEDVITIGRDWNVI